MFSVKIQLVFLVYLTIILTVINCQRHQRQQGNRPTERPPRFLSLPIPEKCSSRPKEFFLNGHNYFFSGHLNELKGKNVDWLDGRNICREFCMDLVSIESQEENNLIFRLIQQRVLYADILGGPAWWPILAASGSLNALMNDVPYIWTSGRLCDFKGCENRADLEPKSVNGWFWSGTRARIFPTNRLTPGWRYNAWSSSGHKKIPQPDNAEHDINRTPESCLAVLNNVYNDGIAWHDIACYHEKPIVCEDSEELLNYVASTNPGIRL